MSMELYVISPKRLATIEEWQRAVDELGFSIKFSPDTNFEKVGGFLPLQLRGKLSGFECDHWALEDITETYSELRIEPSWRYVLAFRWGGNYEELISVMQASAAYAVATGGLAFDPQENEILSNEKSIQLAKNIEKEVEFLRSLP
jgi:hypothetical protein